MDMYNTQIHTGTTNNVDKKLDRYDSKYGCEFFCLPSMSIVLGISGTKLNAALKQASANKIVNKKKCIFLKSIYE